MRRLAVLDSPSPITAVTLAAWRAEPSTTNRLIPIPSMGPRPGQCVLQSASSFVVVYKSSLYKLVNDTRRTSVSQPWTSPLCCFLCFTALRITNSPVADVFIVWAKSDPDGKIRGFILEKVGLSVSMRAILLCMRVYMDDWSPLRFCHCLPSSYIQTAQLVMTGDNACVM